MSENNIENNTAIELNNKQKKCFKEEIMIGIYKQLYQNGFLTDMQLTSLLKIHGR